ncbi:MAG: biotin/lipoyl-binding protein [Planctomycetes bacterium]|nr:biotin/lipoyl-binding protein [Planctomycetota bacterium]
MKLRITVHGVAYEVEVEVLDPGEGFLGAGPLPPLRMPEAPAPPHGAAGAASAHAGREAAPVASVAPGAVSAPIAGTVLEVKCRAGDAIEKGQILVVVEAMKMETSIAAPVGGRVKKVLVAVGDNVREGQAMVELE